MSGNKLVLFGGGALVVVGLALGAGFVGATLAQAPAAAPVETASAPGGDATLRARVDSLERRLDAVAERLRVTEETANQALDRSAQLDQIRRDVTALQRRFEGLPAAPATAAAAGSDDIVLTRPLNEMDPEERAGVEEALRERFVKKARELEARHAGQLMEMHLNNLRDTSEDASNARRSQVNAEARQLAVAYRLDGTVEGRVRDILAESLDASVRDVAPYLGGGLERADYDQVRQRLAAIWDARDAKIAALLADDEARKEYADRATDRRRVLDEALSRMSQR